MYMLQESLGHVFLLHTLTASVWLFYTPNMPGWVLSLPKKVKQSSSKYAGVLIGGISTKEPQTPDTS